MASPINNLGTLQSIELKSSISTKLNPDYFDRKSKQRDKLKSSFLELTEHAHKEEEKIRSRVTDLETQLAVLETKKKRRKINYKMQSGALEGRVSELYEDLEHLEKELQRQHRISAQLDEETSLEKSEKIQKFEVSLRPLREAADIVTEEKQKVQEQLSSLQEQLSGLTDLYKELLDSAQKDKQDIKTYQMYKTSLDSTIEGLMKHHPLEFNEIDTEIKTKKELTLLSERKLRQASELNETDRKIAEMERDLEAAKQDLTKWEQQRRSGSSNFTQEAKLVNLEQKLLADCQELGILPVPKAVEVAAKEHGIELANCILKEQFKLVQDQQEILLEKTKVQNETVNKEAAKLVAAVELQQTRLRETLESSNPDQGAEQALMEAQQALRRLRNDSELSKRHYACNLANLEKWKLKNKYCLRTPESTNWPTDSDVINEFKAAAQNLVLKSERFSEVESALHHYVKVLTSRDGFTNTKSLIEIKGNSEISQQNNYIQMVESQLTSLQFERESIQKEFMKLVDTEKSSRNKSEAAKSDAAMKREKLIAKRQQEIMQRKRRELKRLQKVVDKHQLKRIELFEYNKIKEDYEARKCEVRKKLEGHYSNLTYWDSEITAIQDKLSSSKQQETKTEILEVKSQTASYRSQLKVMNEAEDELTAKYESMVEVKKQELARNYSKLIVKTGGIVDEDKLDELQLLRSNKEDEVIALEEETKALQDEHSRDLTTLEAKKRELTKLLNQLQKDYQAIQNKKNKATNLQKKLRALEKEMQNIGVSLGALPTKASSQEQKPTPVLAPSANSPEDSEEDSDSFELEPDNMVRSLKRELAVDIRTRDRRNTIMSPISVSGGLKEPTEGVHTHFRFDSSETTSAERWLFDTIIPLLEGSELYKRFARRKSLKSTEFDPLLADSQHIENCGYGYRNLQLSAKLDKIEIRQPNRHGVETTVKVADIRGPTIPRHTMEIIKSQKKQWLTNCTDEHPSYEQVYLEMKRSGIIVYEDPAFQSKSRTAKFYSFFICMENEGRVELVADDYIVFRQWIDGLNALMKHKHQLSRLKHKITIE